MYILRDVRRLRLCQRGLFGDRAGQVLVSEPIVLEYRDVLQRHTKDHGFHIFAKWNRLLTEFSEKVEPISLGGICRDPNDEIYLEAAVGGKAKAIVTGDKDLLVLKKIQEIPILTPKAFLDLKQ
jgi:uncharacterized protein